MLANIQEIIDDVRSLLDEKSDATNKFFVDTEITRWANQGQEEFSTLTRCLSKYYSHTILAADIHNDCELRLSPDFITFDEGGVWYNDKQVEETSITALDEYAGSSWRDHAGTPIQFYRRSDYIGFYPKPSAGDTVKYYAVERAPTLTGDVEPLSGDYRLVAFRRYVRDYAMAQCWYKKGNNDKYREKMGEFYSGVTLVNYVVHGERNQPKKMIPQRRVCVRRIDPLNM